MRKEVTEKEKKRVQKIMRKVEKKGPLKQTRVIKFC
jgi:hypothetical protein